MNNQALQAGDRVSVHAEYCGYAGECGTVRSTSEQTVFVDLDEDERSHAGTAFATSEVKAPVRQSVGQCWPDPSKRVIGCKP